MRILFLTDNFPPEVNAPASRTHEHCREWVRAGHQVTVVTTAPNFPTGRVFPGYSNRLYTRDEIDGIEVVRVWSYVTANEGFLKRTLDYVSFALMAVLVSVFSRRFDVVVGTSPQFFTACAAWALGFLRRRPYVFELRDLWPESIRAVGAMKDGLVLDLLEKLELFLYRHAAAVISVTHAFKTDLIRRGVDADKIHVVTNGADLTRFAPRPRDAVLEAQLGLKDRFVVGYVGTHGMAHALGTALDAAAILEGGPDADRIRFLLLGDGAEKAALKARAADMGLSNVIFVDIVPKSEVARYWSLLDVSLVHLKREPLFETVIPSKLFECMAMGIPVLHGVRGESADIVLRDQVGEVFTPEDAPELAAAASRLAHDKAALEGMAARGVVAARGYDRSALAVRMLEILKSVAR
jgi:glycosyltransferase involved in cell wall biosynthesis